MDHLNMMQLNPDYAGKLRNQYAMLSFLTDAELEKLMSMVQTVSLAIGVDSQVLLEYLSREAQSNVVSC